MNEKGIKQAENLKPKVLKEKIDLIISSPKKRTIKTAEIISDINFYNEQLNSLQSEYYQKAEELKTYKQKIEQIERAMESHSKDMNGIQQILSSLAVCLAKNKNIKIQKEEQ